MFSSGRLLRDDSKSDTPIPKNSTSQFVDESTESTGKKTSAIAM